MSGNRLKLYGLLVLLYVLHTDWWLWSDGRVRFGLPMGLLYHLAYMLATAVVMYMLVKQAWPSHLEIDDAGDDR
ncbi:MAG TPA: DUF3311 domain-containing protein [Acidobacteriota bacterium]|nr:DUF3311 domain-containing protein [Acidobacteriota bacterium]